MGTSDSDCEFYIVPSQVDIVDQLNQDQVLAKLEACGRTCYKSEDKMDANTAAPFIRNIIKRGHESVLEHVSVTVRILCDRGVANELVRHRIASYSQESTRYCDYGYSRISCISPGKYMTVDQYLVWERAMDAAARAYKELRALNCSPQIARSVLPNSLKTEIVTTMNLREWRYVLRVRSSREAHPQMRELMQKLLYEFKQRLPVIFEDINNES
jgi:thymidylate synthase (FAD)